MGRSFLVVVSTIAVALLLLTALESLRATSLLAGFLEAARTLFFFADIAFYVWIPFLVIVHLRLRRAPRPGPTFLGAVAGGVVNVLGVLLIGFVQEGRVADFVALAVEGSLAVVVAAAVVTAVVTRVLPGRRVS